MHAGVALLRMEAGKANAVSPDFLAGLDAVLTELGDVEHRAVVLTGYDRFFSAGLDLRTLSALDRDGMRDFMARFDAVFLRVFTYPAPVVAAVNGHAIAGGCVLAMQADTRIAAAGNAKIGMNETRLGVGLPRMVQETVRLRLSGEQFLPAFLEGRLFDPDEAKRRGLVDEVVPPDDVLPRALARAAELAAVPSPGFAQVKAGLRRETLDRIARHAAADAESWLDTWFADETRRIVAETVAKLGAS
jgi:enoyl-CoA hydratase